MRKVRPQDFETELARDDERVDGHAVHSEPMRVTLGDKLGDAASLRDKIIDDDAAPSAALARTRFTRSVRTLEDTVRHSLREVLLALRGASAHGVAWLQAEARELGGASSRASAPARAHG